MTEREAAIVTAYTGILIGYHRAFHSYAEQLMGRSIFVHEFASEKFMDEIKEKSYFDFISIDVERENIAENNFQ